MNYYVVIFSLILFIDLAVGETQKTSLTFVIDNTYSMTDDIDEAKANVKLVFDAVANSNDSQIENYVLVTFNDPSMLLRTVTNDKNEFVKALENVFILISYTNYDCPELAMAGIELALTHSLPGSYVYALTDASAKDYHLVDKVQNLALTKKAQIVFLLTGSCDEHPDGHPGSQAYYKLADATNGQVFQMQKKQNNIGKVLAYVAETVSKKKTVVTKKDFPAGYGHNMTIPVDPDMSDVVISTSGKKPIIDITAPDGTKPHADYIVDLDKIAIVKINDTKPGDYTAAVGSESATSVLVTATTTIGFEHGFSVFKPSSLKFTSVNPLPDQESHLAIQLTSTDDKAVLKKVVLTDLKGNVITEMPLKLVDAKQKLYDTTPFEPPNSVFKISVEGINGGGEKFVRSTRTPIEPQNPSLVSSENKAPSVVIDGGSSISAEYNDSIKILCRINGYPKPDAMWLDGSGTKIASTYMAVELPYDYVNILEIDKAQRSETYTCEASNTNGKASKEVKTIIKLEIPKIKKEEREITKKRGEDTKISCRIIKGKPTPNIVWNFLPEESPVSVRLDETGEEISLPNVDEDKAGAYRCTATNEAGRDHHIIQLVVNYPPFIIEDEKKILTKEEVEATLRCQAKGVPTPRVHWFLNGVKIVNGKKYRIYRDNSLRFTGSRDNEGDFTCMASNDLGTVNKTTKVDYFAPVTIETPEQSTFVMNERDDLDLPCNATGYPKPTIQWLFVSSVTNKTIALKKRPSDVSEKIIFTRLMKTQDGFYTCIASNKYSSANITYRVKLTVPPKIQKELKRTVTGVVGDFAMRLPCNATGYPKPTITWSTKGFNVASGSEWYNIEEDGTLVIKNPDEKSAGAYVCNAQNSVGTDTQTFNVNIKSSPDESPTKEIFYFENGTSREILCNIPHTKLEIVRWYKDKKIIGTGGTLKLDNVTMSDSGIYTCSVSSFAGSSSESKRIIVGYKPYFVYETNAEIEFFEGITTFMDCEAKGEPKPEVTWFSGDGKTINNKEQVYEKLMTFDVRGKYTCIVSNQFGSISRTFEIASRDCILNIKNDLTKNQPLMVNNSPLQVDQTMQQNEIKYGNIIIPSGTNVTLYCPKGFINFRNVKITATCEGETTFVVDGNKYSYNDLKCLEEVQPSIQRTERQCGSNKNTEEIYVGYELPDGFLKVFEACVDTKSKLPVYAKHEISASSADEDFVDEMWQSDILPLEFDSIYQCKTQINSVSEILGKWFHADDKCCFEKRQLINTRDLSGGLPQKAALNYLNVIPHWSTCNTKNWDYLEKQVRKLAKDSFATLDVWTGASGQLTLKDASGTPKHIDLRDDSGMQLPVPKYVWKVIQSPDTKSSVAVVQLNIPDLTLHEAYQHMFCKDVCKDVTWMSGANWRDLGSGYTFCCSLPDFETALGYKGLFGTGNEKILYELNLLPDIFIT